MIGYFDTSALVPLIVAEQATQACGEFWFAADDVLTCRLTFVETSAALAAANRAGRLDEQGHAGALGVLEYLWRELGVIEVDDTLTRAAGRFAADQALRGYDAVHCAAAASLADTDLVAASGDQALLRAWANLGVSTFNTMKD